jgi:hypothetical protein
MGTLLMHYRDFVRKARQKRLRGKLGLRLDASIVIVPWKK